MRNPVDSRRIARSAAGAMSGTAPDDLPRVPIHALPRTIAAANVRAVMRLATIDDAGELARLFGELGHPTTGAELIARWPLWSAAGNSAIVVAAAAPSAALLGLATLHRTDVLHRPRPVGRITSLVVDARHRGIGLGRELVTAAENALAAAGCGLVEVTSNLRRTDAHAFYERIGYDRTSLRFARSVAP